MADETDDDLGTGAETTGEEIQTGADGQQTESGKSDAELSPIEQIASKMGWRPDGVKDAETFILDGHTIQRELRDTVHGLKRTITRLTKDVQSIATDRAERKAEDIDRQLASLEEEKDAAIADSDKDAVRAIDKKIRDLEAKKPKQDKNSSGNGIDPDAEEAITDFTGRNPWYDHDEELTGIAHGLLETIRTKNPELTIPEALTKLEEKMYSRFPDLKSEGNPGKNGKEKSGAHSSKAGSGNTRGGNASGKRFSASDLSDAQRTLARDFVRMGAFKSEQDYVNSLVKEGILK
jgi:hypothetical protein